MKFKHYLLMTIAVSLLTVCTLQFIKISNSLDAANRTISELKKELAGDMDVDNQGDFPPPIDFSLTNADCETVTLNNMSKGKMKLLVFANASCSYCDEFYPELDEFSKTYNNSFEVIVIKYGATVEQLEKTMLDKNYDFMLWQGTEKVFADYNVSSTPSTYLLDENNRINEIAYPATKQELEEWVFAI